MTASGSYRLIPKVRSILLDSMSTVAQRGQVVAGGKTAVKDGKRRQGNGGGVRRPRRRDGCSLSSTESAKCS